MNGNSKKIEGFVRILDAIKEMVQGVRLAETQLALSSNGPPGDVRCKKELDAAHSKYWKIVFIFQATFADFERLFQGPHSALQGPGRAT